MIAVTDRYQIVQLAGGDHSVRSIEYGETFHPVIGPAREARALYVEQLELPKRIASSNEEFVIWDIGLGAAANPLTLLNFLSPGSSALRIISFDKTTEPLEFGLRHGERLPFLNGWESILSDLLAKQRVLFTTKTGARVHWDLHLGDFPALISSEPATELPKPHAIFFDAYSPKTNPEMWSVSLFTNLYKLLDPARPCAMPTYSRSTMLRTTLLVTGFFVGRGHATGEKEETTIAANSPDLIREPLDTHWLRRAMRSTSAEPLAPGHYRQAPLSPETLARLHTHPQFSVTKALPKREK